MNKINCYFNEEKKLEKILLDLFDDYRKEFMNE